MSVKINGEEFKIYLQDSLDTIDNFIDIELFKRNREEHILNDNRAKIKKEINNLTHSEIIEEKQFISYNI